MMRMIIIILEIIIIKLTTRIMTISDRLNHPELKIKPPGILVLIRVEMFIF